MRKVVTKEQIRGCFFNGMTIMVGGFMGCGTPEGLIDLIIELDIKDITLIATDTATIDRGVGRLIVGKRVKKLYASHIGLNPETGRQMNKGSLEVELVPQGTLVERIRAGGFGLGGVLTPTGLGTIIEEGKEIIEVDGQKFLLEKPLKADVSLIRGSLTDCYGNTIYRGTSNNFNQMMATAGETVIVETEKLVPAGSLNKESITTPSIFVDYVIRGGGDYVY
ncbi:CoA transferase subunit A [Vallitalea okinawensis]|uniref:CoA transferase subunit A n=1 Tax=Vallitalea okinawensis TaxID=2078660 RepID=UPI000CFC8227|nr:CoA transferase subunit A [Vallitalea okinawensis]